MREYTTSNFLKEHSLPCVNASHILGYVKEVDRDIRGSLIKKNEYELGDVIGWSGLERNYESYLKGSHGIQFFQVDALDERLAS